MIIRNQAFDFKDSAYIMGILNLTPDSFSDGGRFNTLEPALDRVRQMVAEGAAMVDIGGESTRPGYTPISSQAEIDRILPVIKAIRQEFPDLVLSVDTFKAKTLAAALEAGVDILNDIWGLKADPDMAKLAKEARIPVILMHNNKSNQYGQVMAEVLQQTQASLDLAEAAGIDQDKIILDPGIGFAKDYEKDLMVLNHLEDFTKWGLPVLLGTSRKRFVGTATGVSQADQRTVGTAATTAVGVMKGASIFRVHDIKENYQAMRMALAIKTEGAIRGSDRY